jgi:CBS domain-containing protein
MLGNSLTTPLQKVMTKVIYYVSPNESVECCLAQMSDKHIRHLPVISDEKLVGLVSMGDVVKDLIQDQKELIVGLENSILGREIQH